MIRTRTERVVVREVVMRETIRTIIERPQTEPARSGPQDCQPSGAIKPDVGLPAKVSASGPILPGGSGAARVRGG